MTTGRKFKSALWLVCTALYGCTDANLFRIVQPPPIAQNTITIEGTYCATEPAQLVFPVKILFIFDDSGSMAESDPAFRRLAAARSLVQALLEKDEVYFGVERFQGGMPYLLTTDPVFTRDEQRLGEALADGQHAPDGSTPYVGALSTAITALKEDINADPRLAGRTRYVIIFLSDGEPTDDQAPYAQILDRVTQLEQLEQGSPAAGEVTLHTAYLEANGDDTGGAHLELLHRMAEMTGGQFRNFESGEDIDFSGFDVTAISRDYRAVFPLLVSNTNARLSIEGLIPDSDGDGLADERELALGTDPTVRDSDGDGCGDLMEASYARWDPLTPGWMTEPAHCECQDELRSADSDGDGLTDCEESWLGLDRRNADSDTDVAGKMAPDNMLDGLELAWHLGRTLPDAAEDYDRDGWNNLEEISAHTDPNYSDAELRERYAYRYEYIRQDPALPNCYHFRVSNVGVVQTLATADQAAGENRIWLYFVEAPQDDPHRERVVQAAKKKVFFDGWAPMPTVLRIEPEDFSPLDGATPGGSGNCTGGCPPQAEAGPDVVLVDADGDGSERMLLDAGASSDRDGRIVACLWREGGATLATSCQADVMFGLGEHQVQLVVMDDDNLTATDTLRVTVTPKTTAGIGELPPDEDTTGGCSTGGAVGGMNLLILLLLVLRRQWRGLLLLPACFLGCASPEIAVAVHGIPIINGSRDTNPAHQAVVALTFGGSLCSGTLIAPDVVLTAGHCAYGFGPTDYTVHFGNQVPGTQTRQVSEVRVHPAYDASRIVNDIALLRLSSPAPAQVVPIPYLPRALAIAQQELPKSLEYVGFGRTEYNQVGVKLTVTAQADWICESASGCTVGPGYPASANTICGDQSPGGPCNGDSGGPAFVVRNGIEYVAGVTSYGDQYCQYFGCSTKVDAFESFIADFVGGVLGSPCTDASRCLSGYCVNGVCCESACQGTCLACNLPGAAGTCLPAPNGTPCPDGNACNGEEVCLLQECVSGAPLDCDDQNPCTLDECRPDSGCRNIPLADGTLCSDQDVCNGVEICQAGRCVAHEVPDCDDHNPCSEDSCDALSGCIHTPLPDGSDCSGPVCGGAACQEGACLPVDGSCDDRNPCTEDGCLEEGGCFHRLLEDGTKAAACRVCLGGQIMEDPNCVVAGSLGCISAAPGGLLGLAPVAATWLCRRRRTREPLRQRC